MLAWMVYVAAVSLLLAGAAFAAERSAQARKAPTRWLWGASILASLALPMIMSSVSIQLPRLPGPAGLAPPRAPLVLHEMTISALRPSAWLDTTIGPAATAPALDVILAWAWAGASAAILLAILFQGARLHRRRRAWTRGEIAGASVEVSEDVGPAVVGLLRPRVVVPRWITEADPQTQALVIAHERSHLDARDAQLLALAILLIVAMPWNLPLWWQLRRLRLAIEMDCDLRVLKGGHDVARYGEALILVGERQSSPVAVVAAMSEPRSFLEQRIRKMLWEPKKFTWAAASATACLAFVLAASAAEVSPPDAGPAPFAGSAAAPKLKFYVMRPYYNRQWGFSLQAPKAWTEFAPDPGNSRFEVARFLSQPQVGERHALFVFRGPYDPAKGVSAVIDGTEPGLVQGGFAHFTTGEAKLGARTIRTLTFDRQMSDRLWSCRYYFLPRGHHVYILGFGTTNPQEMFPLFDRLAGTFVDEGGPAEVPDSAIPAFYRGPAGGPSIVEIRVVDSAPDSPGKARGQRFTAPDGSFLWLEPGAPITGRMFASAQATQDPDGHPAVDFTLTPDGSTRLAALTRANIGHRLAILVNGNVVFAPVVRDEIAGGKGMISGRFTPEETEALAKQINAAAGVRQAP